MKIPKSLIVLFVTFLLGASPVSSQTSQKLKIRFVDYFFENGSPLLWQIVGDTILRVELLPDYERESLNRQTTHWHFRVDADSGSLLKISISKMVNEIYNTMPASEWWGKIHPTSCYISWDHINWQPVMTKLSGDRELIADIKMQKPSVWIARLPVYSISDLEHLKDKYKACGLFTLIPIGETVEGRPLEIIRLGNPDAPHSVVIRARAHPWEPGGNWIIEGLVRKFISENKADWQRTFCVYIMPLANKDGVVRGMTRFNIRGMDPNRKWDSMSDPALCPEKFALEKFIEGLELKGIKPGLGIDIHNDDAGGIDFSTHKVNDTLFIKNAERLDKLMRHYTCFSEKTSYSWEQPGQKPAFVLFEDGLLNRYGIESIVWELNANWINSKQGMPVAEDWIHSGEELNNVFYEYFRSPR